ncbi:bifunctional DNA primase/polymerase [Hymenobacter swuensis]|uniref:DNA primase/polymerase bifunctional N-terminal domain-containing protein n=1 Tax=Hymenobacter swuensis DY53 TaxID=1227739 RepID=W8EQW5_9BACT|nr:bifunctional DNA primase/polymerase [Hymenobacter swuensis]AHJ95534.1 hypothetical protein Hsw_PA0201 [Hymenobacter swuensis DY53]
MTNLSLFASHYRKLGLPVTRISNILNEHNFFHKNIFKTPDHQWQHLFTQPQSDDEFKQLTWNNATGLGTVSGPKSLLVIDIDGCTDYKLVEKTLAELGLPPSYEWVVTSGSGSGFHIFVYADKFRIQSNSLAPSASNHVVTTFMPGDGYLQRFDKIEFLWSTHVVLPPSLHHTGNRYEFLNCRLPRALPQRVKQSGLYDIVRKHCDAQFIEGRDGYKENDFEVAKPNVPTDLEEWNAADVEGGEIFCVVCIRPEANMPLSATADLRQIAWVVMDKLGKVHNRRSYLLKPQVAVSASGATSYSTEVNTLLSQDPLTVFKELNRDLRLCTALVSFDVKPVLALLQEKSTQYSLYHTLTQLNLVCLKKPRGGNKANTLADLYLSLFRYDVHQIPDAESDALIMAKCLRAILRKRQDNKEDYYSIYLDREGYGGWY